MKNSNLYSVAIISAGLISLTSCVSKKKLLDSQIAYRYLQNDSARLANKVAEQGNEIDQLNQKISELNAQIAKLNNENDNLARDANSNQKQLDENRRNLQGQIAKTQQLQALLDAQKEKANALRQKMVDALNGFSSKELTISQKNGKVYVSLQENLLFPSNSATVNEKGKLALAKLADVLNQNQDISVDIEGHTDSIPIRGGKFQDNWALSTARATSIVRILVNDYKVKPESVIASGHSSYDPVDTNATPEGRAKNRRTEIILSPKLDELYKLIEGN